MFAKFVFLEFMDVGGIGFGVNELCIFDLEVCDTRQSQPLQLSSQVLFVIPTYSTGIEAGDETWTMEHATSFQAL